uniref:Mei2-like C-terminal RNA recognition motif domain-containing protein n=1 Tax=Pyrodinium bahamense TaxID=73915 RepID=A0A7R9ZXX5_9DINO|mmetsp:Transcript_14307/g.39597  ORF Transcript_14307/g.39597 Transcript_14307/m.39597 type:complete len:513 (+) Transcript_14307:72-1610(+)
MLATVLPASRSRRASSVEVHRPRWSVTSCDPNEAGSGAALPTAVPIIRPPASHRRASVDVAALGTVTSVAPTAMGPVTARPRGSVMSRASITSQRRLSFEVPETPDFRWQSDPIAPPPLEMGHSVSLTSRRSSASLSRRVSLDVPGTPDFHWCRDVAAPVFFTLTQPAQLLAQAPGQLPPTIQLQGQAPSAAQMPAQAAGQLPPTIQVQGQQASQVFVQVAPQMAHAPVQAPMPSSPQACPMQTTVQAPMPSSPQMRPMQTPVQAPLQGLSPQVSQTQASVQVLSPQASPMQAPVQVPYFVYTTAGYPTAPPAPPPASPPMAPSMATAVAMAPAGLAPAALGPATLAPAMPTSPVLPAAAAPATAATASAHGKTLMLRNIPVTYTRERLLADLDLRGFRGAYDFFYLPIDFQTGNNVGYAFVNLVSEADGARFKATYEGLPLSADRSNKICAVCDAQKQGLYQNVEHYRNSPVMGMEERYHPLIFENGMRQPFPGPTRPLKQVRQRATKAVG